MATYTFIMEYRDGTYVSQVSAASVQTAVTQWAQNLNPGEITYFGTKLKKRLIEGLADDQRKLYKPVELRGLKNVWYISVPQSGMSVNAVKTDLSR
jgi:hypothetical protein